MQNVFFPNETVAEDDLYFMCALVERIARKQHIRNRDVVNHLGYRVLCEKLSLAQVLHCENPLKVTADFIEDYNIPSGSFDITDIDRNLTPDIPTPLQMGAVYKRLILMTLEEDEDYAQGMLRVYNDWICEKIDDYSCSAYYEPSYCLVKAYYAGTFDFYM